MLRNLIFKPVCFILMLFLSTNGQAQTKHDLCLDWKCVSEVKNNDKFLYEDTLVFRALGTYENDSSCSVPYLKFHSFFRNNPKLFSSKVVNIGYGKFDYSDSHEFCTPICYKFVRGWKIKKKSGKIYLRLKIREYTNDQDNYGVRKRYSYEIMELSPEKLILINQN